MYMVESIIKVDQKRLHYNDGKIDKRTVHLQNVNAYCMKEAASERQRQRQEKKREKGENSARYE